jgi:phage terminase small subunit
MNTKHALFAETYLANGRNATQAYISVFQTKSESVARTNASRLLTNANVAEYIKLKTRTLSEKLGITSESQLLDLQDIKEKCMQTESFGFDPANAIKAIETQNRMLGLNEPDQLKIESVSLASVLQALKSDGNATD